jgi:hypothetical protein
MSERTLKKLRQEVREKEVEKKVEAFSKEHIEKKKAEHVQLIGTIYVKLLTSCTPTTKEI